MPRQPKHLPYLRVNRAGRLQYYRRIPADRRHLFGNKGAFTLVLDCDPSKPKSKAARHAWKQADTAYEQQLAGSTAPKPQIPAPDVEKPAMSPRDLAGLAAEPLRTLLKAGESGQISREMEDLLESWRQLSWAMLEQVLVTNNLQEAQRIKRLLIEELVGDSLHRLQIKADADAMAVIEQKFKGYLPAYARDLAKREAGDWSPSELERISPPPPQSQVTYEDLLQQWLLDAGGLRRENGIGVSEKRYECYQRVISELTRETGKQYPGEITTSDARRFINWIQEGSLAIRTKQQRITCISNLFGIAVRFGLLDANPFAEMRIKTPKNVRESNYRPFTKPELQAIHAELKHCKNQDRAIIVKTLLVTGARSSDISKLRYQDIKRSASGVLYLDLVDDPNGTHPHPLKGGASDERKTPLHPWLIAQGFTEYEGSGMSGYIFGDEDNSKLSGWFNRLLKRVGIDEPRCAVLHSLRGTWIDLMREARLPQDVRRAVTGHSSRDVQDRTYGEGLQNMPDVLHQELVKIDLSWLS